MMKLLFAPKVSWLGRLGLGAVSVLAVVIGLTIASFLFVTLLVAGTALAGWLWWRLRRLARQAQQAAPEILEGEYTVLPDPPALENRHPPSPGTRRAP